MCCEILAKMMFSIKLLFSVKKGFSPTHNVFYSLAFTFLMSVHGVFFSVFLLNIMLLKTS